ncbi:MAG: 6-phosphogluconolactonase [Pseudomonadota bacterium]
MLIEYVSRRDLMTSVADQVAQELRAAIRSRGQASMAVPGGTTPRPFFEALRVMDLDWSAVTICLTDERIVPETSDRSNTALVKDGLLRDAAAAAQFLNILESPQAIEAVLPLDVIVLGMGTDMHTASLFPDALQLQDALSDAAPLVMMMSTPTGGEDRVSLTAPVLRSARHAHVLITGAEKRAAYDIAQKALTEAQAPIRIVLMSDPPATVHFAE